MAQPDMGLHGAYKLAPDINTYAKVARGYRAGNINGGFGFGKEPSVVGPEYVTAYELGVKSELFDKRLTVNVSPFYNDYKDLQLTTLDNTTVPPTIVTANAGHVGIYGIELESAILPFTGFRAQGSVGYQKSKFISTTYFSSPFTGLPELGRELPKSPHLNLSGIVQYEFPAGPWHGRVATDWSYRSTAPGQPEGANGVYAPLALPSGAIGNVTLSALPTDNIELSVFVNNVTNNNKLNATRFFDGGGVWLAAGNPLVKPLAVGLKGFVRF